MLGSPIQMVRDHAVIMLNILYDGVDWSRRAPFSTKISKVNSKFIIEYLIESDESDENIVFLVKSFVFLPQARQNIISIHKPKLKEFKVRAHASVILPYTLSIRSKAIEDSSASHSISVGSLAAGSTTGS